MPEPQRVHHATDEVGVCACGWRSKGQTEPRKVAGLRRHIRARELAMSGSTTSEAAETPTLTMYEGRSLTARFQRLMSAVLSWFVRPSTITAVGYLSIFWIAWFLAAPARDLNSGWLFGAVSVIFGAVIIAFVGIALMARKIRFVFGAPIFGRFGLPSRTYSAALRGARHVEIDFPPEALGDVRYMSDVDADLTERAIRHAIQSESGPMSDDAWGTMWEEQILPGARVGDLSFRDTLAKDSLSYNVVLARLLASQTGADLVLILANLIVVALAVLYIGDSISLLRLVQAGIVASLVLALVVILMHRFLPDELHFVPPVAESVPEELEGQMQQLAERTATPDAIRVDREYGTIVALYHAGIVGLNALWLTGSFAIWSAGLLAFAFLWTFGIDGETTSAYLQLLLVLAGGFVGFAAVALAMFFVIDRSKAAVIAVGTAVVLAVAPPVLNYLFTGVFDLREVSNAVTGVIGAAAVLVVKAVIDDRRAPA